MTRAEILAAVLGDADLLFAIQQSAPPAVGPWVRDTYEGLPFSVRKEPCGGENAAIVEVFRVREGGTSVRIWVRGYGGPRATEERPATFAEAEQWCDARLREAGVMLAGGEK
jgi:hypothetical protein